MLHESTEQIAYNEGRPGCIAIQNMLMGYRSTPHPATGYSPYEASHETKHKDKTGLQIPIRNNSYSENGNPNDQTGY